MKIEDISISEDQLDLLSKVNCYRLLVIKEDKAEFLHRFSLIDRAGLINVEIDGRIKSQQQWSITKRGETILRSSSDEVANDWLKRWARYDGLIREEKLK